MPTAPEFQERHHDYVFPATFPGVVTQAQPLTLDPGETKAGLQFQLDADWPFELRGMAARVPYSVEGGTQAGIEFISARWSGPQEDYRQADFVPLNMMLGPYFGQVGNPRPVFPCVRCPRSGIISIDLRNEGPSPVEGLQLFFRGVKLYPQGTPFYTYPADVEQRRKLPFWYELVVPQVPVSGPPILNQPFAPENDSDFVFRFGQAGQLDVFEVFLMLKDESMKPYSNAPVHADVLFGRSLMPPIFEVPGGNAISPVGPGASAPGLLVPEIYLPRNHKMWFDLYRDDSAYPGPAPVDYPLTFGGMKVF